MSSDMNHWVITAEERSKHDAQFDNLKPVNGLITGEQVKPLFMKSQLPKAVLGQIWTLADINGDGKLDRREFSVAIHLIRKKIQKIDLPKTLPDSLKTDPIPDKTKNGSLNQQSAKPVSQVSSPPTVTPNIPPTARVVSPQPSPTPPPAARVASPPAAAPPAATPPPAAAPPPAATPVQAAVAARVTSPAVAVQRSRPPSSAAGSASVSPLNSPSLQHRSVGATSPPNIGGDSEWAMPQTIQDKYHKLFNDTDKLKQGFVSGKDAKILLSKSKLNNKQLATIWGLADVNGDGKLSYEEFIIAMYYIEAARAGRTLPSSLPHELIPPAYRTKSSSVQKPVATRPTPVKASADLLLLDDPFGGPPADLPPPTLVASGSRQDLGLTESRKEEQPIEKQRNEVKSDEVSRSGGGAELNGWKKSEDKTQSVWPTDQQQDVSNGRSVATTENLFTDDFKPNPALIPGALRNDDDDDDEDDAETLEIKKQNAARGMEEIERLRREQEEEKKRKEEEANIERERQEQERLERLQKEREAKIKQEKERQARIEAEKEEQRKKAAEQKEAARRESERQRQMDWERQRRDQLTILREREQVQVEQIERDISKLKNQIALLADKKSSTQLKIDKGRQMVTECTASIESMRSERDRKINAIEQVNRLIETGKAKQELLNQQQSMLERQLDSYREQLGDAQRVLLNNVNKKQSAVTSLNAKLERIDAEIITRTNKVEQNNNKLAEMKERVTVLYAEVKDLEQRLQIKRSEWSARGGGVTEQPAHREWTDRQDTTDNAQGMAMDDYIQYTALYQFDSRCKDELSLKPGDTVWVKKDQSGQEVGWLSGWMDEVVGCFPEAYVEPVDGVGVVSAAKMAEGLVIEESQDLGGMPSILISSAESLFHPPATACPSISDEDGGVVVRVGRAIHDWDSRGDQELDFIKGELINVRDTRRDSWWSGEINGKIGWFPKLYVELVNESQSSSGDTAAAESSAPESVTETAAVEIAAVAMETAAAAVAAELDMDEAVFDESAPAAVATQLNEGQTDQVFKATHIAAYDYISNEAGDLSFSSGQLIAVLHSEGEWWKGKVEGGGEGIFPGSFVQPLDEDMVVSGEGGRREFVDDDLAAEVEASAEALVAAASGAAVQQIADLSSYEPAAESSYEAAASSYEAAVSSCYEESSNITAAEAVTSASAASELPAADEEIEEPPKVEPVRKKEIATVMAAYDATGPEQLSLLPGQLLQIVRKTDTGWWEGQLQVRGIKKRIGWFPASYVKVLGPGSSQRSSIDLTGEPQSPLPVTSHKKKVAPQVELRYALYDYEAQQEDELGFKLGDVIRIISRDHQDWWKGELSGRTGIFPSNFVGSQPPPQS